MSLRFSIFGNHYHFTFKMLGPTLIFVLLFSSLGAWQCQRAEKKRLLIQAYQERPTQGALPFSKLFEKEKDHRFYSIHLKGHYDNAHSLFLDNKTLDGQLGYEVYTPFLVEGEGDQALLIDRGWVPANPDRRILPSIQPIQAHISLKGVVNAPPAYFSLGKITENQPSFPLRVQYINIQELAPLLGLVLPPYIAWLDPADPHGFKRQWKVTLMGPEKHTMYAVQWFAFAISLLVIFVVLNLRRVDQ